MCCCDRVGCWGPSQGHGGGGPLTYLGQSSTSGYWHCSNRPFIPHITLNHSKQWKTTEIEWELLHRTDLNHLLIPKTNLKSLYKVINQNERHLDVVCINFLSFCPISVSYFNILPMAFKLDDLILMVYKVTVKQLTSCFEVQGQFYFKCVTTLKALFLVHFITSCWFLTHKNGLKCKEIIDNFKNF